MSLFHLKILNIDEILVDSREILHGSHGAMQCYL
jgi:hypothetical protein